MQCTHVAHIILPKIVLPDSCNGFQRTVESQVGWGTNGQVCGHDTAMTGDYQAWQTIGQLLSQICHYTLVVFALWLTQNSILNWFTFIYISLEIPVTSTTEYRYRQYTNTFWLPRINWANQFLRSTSELNRSPDIKATSSSASAWSGVPSHASNVNNMARPGSRHVSICAYMSLTSSHHWNHKIQLSRITSTKLDLHTSAEQWDVRLDTYSTTCAACQRYDCYAHCPRPACHCSPPAPDTLHNNIVL